MISLLIQRSLGLAAVVIFVLLAEASKSPTIRFSCLIIAFIVLVSWLLGNDQLDDQTTPDE